jgi:RNA polymerase sigma factor (sigma-70 family)
MLDDSTTRGVDRSSRDWPADVGRSDAELIAAVRTGDSSGFAELWTRHHSSVLGYARQFGPTSNAEDLVSEAFARLLRVLRAGGGPDMNVRPYLLTAVKRLRIDIATRYERRVGLTSDDADLEVGSADGADDAALELLEGETVWKAYSTLPERWQTVLWHTIIEEQPPAQVAPILGSTPNAVAALSMRAREGLRQAFLQAHVADADSARCHKIIRKLGAWERRALSSREAAQVDVHLADCDRCQAAALEIGELNRSLRGVVLPILLGGTAYATKFLASTAGSSTAGVSTGIATGRLRRIRHASERLGDQLFIKPLAIAAVGVTAAIVAAAAFATYPRTDSSSKPVVLLPQSGVSSQAPSHASPRPSAASTPSTAPSPSRTPQSTVAPSSQPRYAPVQPPSLAQPVPGSVQITSAPLTRQTPTNPQGPVTVAPSGSGPSSKTPMPSTTPTPSPTPTTGGALAPTLSVVPPPPTVPMSVDRTVTVTLHPSQVNTTSVAMFVVPPNWKLDSVLGPGSDLCSVESATTARCDITTDTTLAEHVFTLSATGIDPQPSDALLVTYQDALGGSSLSYPLA